MADLKTILAKVKILKSYSSLVVPAVIAIVAVVIFIPTTMMNSRLRDRIQRESVSRMAKAISNLADNAVSRDQWKIEQEYQGVYENAASELENLVLGSSRRAPLDYGLFPKPVDTSSLIFERFGREFRRAIDQLAATVGALDCPSSEELARAMDISGQARLGGRRLRFGGAGSAYNQAIVDGLCLEKAQKAGVYLNPNDVGGYEFWADYKIAGIEKDIENAWYAQMAYWIIADVFKTVEKLNSGSASVLNAPVKRILSIGFLPREKLSASRSAGAENRPKYVFTDEDALVQPLTARYCDDKLDVVHFNIALVLDNAAVLSFMRELCSGKEHTFAGISGTDQPKIFQHNQITVLQTVTWPVRRDAEGHIYYRYSDDTVVELGLVCEYIFVRDGYEEMKPEVVKTAQDNARAAAVARASGRSRGGRSSKPSGRGRE